MNTKIGSLFLLLSGVVGGLVFAAPAPVPTHATQRTPVARRAPAVRRAPTVRRAVVSRRIPTKSSLLLRGKRIAKASFGAMRKALLQAISKKGFAGGIRLCSTKAMPLTQKLSKKFGVTIARISHKARNPANRANPEEMKIIAAYIKQLKTKQKPKPQLVRRGKVTIFYAPIILNNPFCLHCHGRVGKELKPSLYKLIRQLYPKGEAIHFKKGALRGLWKITFHR